MCHIIIIFLIINKNHNQAQDQDSQHLSHEEPTTGYSFDAGALFVQS